MEGWSIEETTATIRRTLLVGVGAVGVGAVGYVKVEEEEQVKVEVGVAVGVVSLWPLDCISWIGSQVESRLLLLRPY